MSVYAFNSNKTEPSMKVSKWIAWDPLAGSNSIRMVLQRDILQELPEEQKGRDKSDVDKEKWFFGASFGGK